MKIYKYNWSVAEYADVLGFRSTSMHSLVRELAYPFDCIADKLIILWKGRHKPHVRIFLANWLKKLRKHKSLLKLYGEDK